MMHSFYTRGDWKVRSVVHYFSNGSANQHMFGIILNNYISSTFSHEGDMKQSEKNIIVNMGIVCILEKVKFQ